MIYLIYPIQYGVSYYPNVRHNYYPAVLHDDKNNRDILSPQYYKSCKNDTVWIYGPDDYYIDDDDKFIMPNENEYYYIKVGSDNTFTITTPKNIVDIQVYSYNIFGDTFRASLPRSSLECRIGEGEFKYYHDIIKFEKTSPNTYKTEPLNYRNFSVVIYNEKV